jgi:protein SCO1/2
MTKATLLAICFCACMSRCPATERRHFAEGMVVEVDKEALSIVVSCEAIPGYMDAMEMPFQVRNAAVLAELRAGLTVHFTMVEDDSHVFADEVRVVRNVNGEVEPVEAARLAFLRRTLDPAAGERTVQLGQVVPDFALIDQEQRSIHFSQFKGKVVALTFGYSRCPNPNYCFRLSNNLAQLERRFSGPNAGDLVLITILIDPANDQPGALGSYAKTWKADPSRWLFLTGPVEQLRSVATLFGTDFWDDEGFLTHSFHTAVIDRDGRLVANLEGNRFTPKQLGDLVESVLHGRVNGGGETR